MLRVFLFGKLLSHSAQQEHLPVLVRLNWYDGLIQELLAWMSAALVSSHLSLSCVGKLSGWLWFIVWLSGFYVSCITVLYEERGLKVHLNATMLQSEYVRNALSACITSSQWMPLMLQKLLSHCCVNRKINVRSLLLHEWVGDSVIVIYALGYLIVFTVCVCSEPVGGSLQWPSNRVCVWAPDTWDLLPPTCV